MASLFPSTIGQQHLQGLLKSLYASRCRNNDDDNNDGVKKDETIVRVRCKSSSDTSATWNVHLFIAVRSTGSNSLFQRKNYYKYSKTPSETVLLPDHIKPYLWLHCIDWMYFGCLKNCIATKNMTSVSTLIELWKVAACPSLDMKELKRYCLDRITEGLDYENYQTIQSFAAQHKLYELKHKSQRFVTFHEARDEVARHKIQISQELQKVSREMDRLNTKREGYERQLLDVEDKWQTLLQKQQREQENQQHTTDATNITPSEVYPSGKREQEGGVGHVVCYQSGLHSGSVKYGDKDNSQNWNDFEITPPKPPNRQQFQTYGIVYSHDSLKHAIEKSEPGDRIYLEPAPYPDVPYTMDTGEYLTVDKNLEILALRETSPEKTVLYLQNGIDVTKEASLRIANITLKYGYSGTDNSDDHHPPLVTVDSENAKLFLDNCVFDMGTDQQELHDKKKYKQQIYGEGGKTLLHRGLISGVFADRAAAVILNGCRFSGGCGSSVLFKYDPYDYAERMRPMLEIIDCSFSNTGAPNTKQKHENEFLSPPFSTVELWRVQQRREGKIPLDLPVRLSGNSISNNFQAPVGYRLLHHGDTHLKSTVLLTAEEEEEASITTASQASLSIAPFEILFSTNTIQSNGLGLNRELWAPSWKTRGNSACKHIQKKKKQAEENSSFPDGATVLAVRDIDVSTFNDPYYMLMGEPSEADYYPGSSDDEEDNADTYGPYL